MCLCMLLWTDCSIKHTKEDEWKKFSSFLCYHIREIKARSFYVLDDTFICIGHYGALCWGVMNIDEKEIFFCVWYLWLKEIVLNILWWNEAILNLCWMRNKLFLLTNILNKILKRWPFYGDDCNLRDFFFGSILEFSEQLALSVLLKWPVWLGFGLKCPNVQFDTFNLQNSQIVTHWCMNNSKYDQTINSSE